MDLDKIIGLFEQRYTAQLSNRQATTIVQLCKSMVNEDQQIGFFYCDLPKVARVIELVNGKLVERNVSYKKQPHLLTHLFKSL